MHGLRTWSSLERRLRMEARWADRRHVTLGVHLRTKPPRHPWEVSVEFDLKADAEMESLSTDIAWFFAAAR
jgi:hypothetical protein